MRKVANRSCSLRLFSIFDWEMAADKERRWIYSKENLEETPSRKDRIDADKELTYRQQAANLIQDMGQRLSVNQLTINTAIVYMHRFYVYHSFTVFSRYAIAPTALFLAAKVEEQPKKLEHVLKICHACLHPDKPHLDTHSDAYLKQAQELVQNELALLQTLGFEISVDHPHTHVVKCTQLVKASRDLSQMAYFMATNSLHLTTFCLLYKPTVVAAMCIHLSCKWSNYEIPLSSDGKAYWAYMDSCITEPLLDQIINEFLQILKRCPTRLRKLKNYRPSQSSKEGGEIKDELSDLPPPPPAQSQPEQSQASVPAKEKKPTMSYEEYKRTHSKSQQKQPHPHHKPHHQLVPGQIKKENHGPTVHSSHDATRPNHSLPHHNVPRSHHAKDHPGGIHTSKPQHPSHRGPSDSSRRVAPPDANQRNMMKPAGVSEKKNPNPAAEQRPKSIPNPHDSNKQPSGGNPSAVARPTSLGSQRQQKPTSGNSDDVSAEVLAMSKDLEGRIRTEKMMQRPVPESSGHHRSATHPSAAVATVQSNHTTAPTDPSRRHHSDRFAHEKESKQLDYKRMVELYRKNPEKLKHYLKHKAQTTPLTNEEKNLYMKIQAKEEEKRKRKAAESQANKLQNKNKIAGPPADPPAAQVESPSGGLTLRIKLGHNPGSRETGPNTSIVKIVGSSSGSGSEASPARSRKRGHRDSTDQSGHSAAKHSRRSEDHHRHHNNSSGNGSSSGGKHRHHNKHQSRSSSGKTAELIDEALFQKSLSDAISKVQQSSGSGVPTVTLKRAPNGKESNYFSTSVTANSEFDPAVPVSASMPEEIFEDDHDSGAFTAPSLSHIGSLASCDSSQSTPEPGEIKDSPPYTKSSKYQKGPGLFSPTTNSLDAKLQRSVSGYHSNQENEFSSPPVLMQKPFVQ